MTRPIDFNADQLKSVCERFGVARVQLFGSAVTGDFGAQSDVDLVIEYASGQQHSLLDVVRLKQELSSVFNGREVDVVIPGDLQPHCEETIFKHVELLYDAAA